jgi:ferredoxin-fold anticodon binding domain-containing protein
MGLQQVENLLIRYRGQLVDIKTVSGGVYEGLVSDVTNDYVALKVKGSSREEDQVIVLLHSIESILPRATV